MLLKDLKPFIFCDLTIISNNEKYKDVWKDSELFYQLSDREVIGIRAKDDYLLISIK